MENKPHYAAAGLFVIVLAAALFAIVLWLTVGFSNKQYRTYLSFVRESVSGLTLKAPVKYNGVVVGYVQDIQLDLKDPKNVCLFLDIDVNVPLHVDTTATIDSSGLTGIAYVGLRGGSPGQPYLEPKHHGKYPVIRYQPSLMVRVDQTLQHLADNLNQISSGVHEVLSEENQQAFRQILQNLATTTSVLANNTQQLQNVIRDTAAFTPKLVEAANQLPQVANNLDASLIGIREAASGVNQASIEAATTLRQMRVTVNSLNSQLMPQASSTLQNISDLADSMSRVSQDVERNPSVIIRGKQAPQPAPGEETR
jgi:phospholipid/cholesterol/gamma-HCH transport system substrate-binding protein